MFEEVREGIRFMRYVAVSKAKFQKRFGTPDWAKRVRPVSTTCRFRLSTKPFCSLVWGQE
ncbi:hypothetical protein Hanom_Chr11g00992161 [Helianthus anomalus]